MDTFYPVKYLAYFPLFSGQYFLWKRTDFRNLHWVRNVQILSFSGPYFPIIGLNTNIYFENINDINDQKFMENLLFLLCLLKRSFKDPNWNLKLKQESFVWQYLWNIKLHNVCNNSSLVASSVFRALLNIWDGAFWKNC